jgi:hypothetical protein
VRNVDDQNGTERQNDDSEQTLLKPPFNLKLLAYTMRSLAHQPTRRKYHKNVDQNPKKFPKDKPLRQRIFICGMEGFSFETIFPSKIHKSPVPTKQRKYTTKRGN